MGLKMECAVQRLTTPDRNQTSSSLPLVSNSTAWDPVLAIPAEDDLYIPTIAWPFILSGKCGCVVANYQLCFVVHV